MKKTFTSLAIALTLGGVVNAQEASQNIAMLIDNTNFTEVADSFDTTVSYSKGVYSINNIFNTGLNLEFILPSGEDLVGPGEDESYVTYTAEFVNDNLYIPYDSYAYCRLTDQENKYGIGATFTNIETNDEFFEELYLYSLTFNYGKARAYYYGDVTYDEDGYYPWILSFPFYGYLNSSSTAESSDWMYINIWMNDLAKQAEGDGVATVAEISSPVYYNLQGVRVENPDNGIYIMQEGTKTVKIVK